MDSDPDSDLSNFCAVTGSTPQVARDYLQIADNNLELAITLYLENGGNTLVSSTQATTTSSPSVTFPTDNITEDNSSNNEILSDEALARQLQEEESLRRPQQRSNEVRAPIAPRTEILTGGGGGGDGSLFDMSMGYGGGGRIGMEGLWGLGGRRRQQQNASSSIFNQGDSSSMSNSPLNLVRSAALAAASGGNSSSSSTNSNSSSRRHSPLSSSPTGSNINLNDEDMPSPSSGGGGGNARTKRLADLFRPPFDIMYRGGFEDARTIAREQKKWLLVNIQDPTEFACQVLNRDLWSDSFVKEIVHASFIFLQYANETPDGKRYLTLYPITHYPHVAIIDPRTGERIKSWEKQVTPTDFMMEVTEFLEQFSSETATSTTMNKSTKSKNQLSEMSEEEQQLNAAIAASLESSIEGTTTGSPPSRNEEDEKMDLDSHNNDDEITTPSILDVIQPINRQETTDMTNSTRIQFRMADGSRVIRRFLKSDPVRYLFEFIKFHVPETQSQAFELVFNRQQLIDILDQEIQVAGLQNAAVNVQFS